MQITKSVQQLPCVNTHETIRGNLETCDEKGRVSDIHEGIEGMPI